ncbi:unnamed protein product, partial [Prorocentrum cordatum]
IRRAVSSTASSAPGPHWAPQLARRRLGPLPSTRGAMRQSSSAGGMAATPCWRRPRWMPAATRRSTLPAQLTATWGRHACWPSSVARFSSTSRRRSRRWRATSRKMRRSSRSPGCRAGFSRPICPSASVARSP